MSDAQPTILILFGITGDLAQRFLLPVIKKMKDEGTLPPKFRLIGASRLNYETLLVRVTEAESELGGTVQKLFYLAVPPHACKEVVDFIETSGLKKGKYKLLLEKPFGHDLTSAEDLVVHIKKHFKENEIYRVDHYLVKNSVQGIIKKSWEKNNIRSIEILASEKLGIEGRVNFYEQTGALQDFVQSHLLELAALTLMTNGGKNIRELRVAALKNLEVVCDITKQECVKRGQYEGYRKEVNNPESMVETFVYINMVSNDPRWQGIAIKLVTGKAMKEKLTQIRITYNDVKNLIFNIDPEPDAYERVITAAVLGNHGLFISSDEVLESWRILDAIQQTWVHSKDDLIIYPRGSEITQI
ncbi:hypothetical protein A3I95_02560 [Candidatus Nomurabacteria bacterium RIFCSPLOWO2_02_FULL_44_12]|nr:MAG: hypothetical protein A3E95_00750 [Candidatus Nomurabacteria bacterium RIFCSPHIGHO2_12_FULL_44_22b]OGJ07044.1 MAG: hypothetical protein A3I95_02560 [Candidatus Nomurabacteria bacterium RIFCSPLOWO2_02_FULL_44_12]